MSNLQTIQPESESPHNVERIDGRAQRQASDNKGQFSILRFIAELRRRKVCRATTMYFVALWIICQIVELVSPHVGLPEWTLSMVIVLGLIGLPIALVLSWLFELTPDGVIVDQPGAGTTGSDAGPRNVLDQVIDCSLVLVALVIGAHLAFGASMDESISDLNPIHRVAIVPFHAAPGSEADALAQSLVADLQHQIVSKTDLIVVVPAKPYLSSDSASLTGTVAVVGEKIRVTAMLVENESGEVTWSDVFRYESPDALLSSGELAEEIVLALPVRLLVSQAQGAYSNES
jgi:TolB-like protein